ncbi:MAG: rhomboid family intramembrane serine protease, partial [Chloroflexota bacterium]
GNYMRQVLQRKGKYNQAYKWAFLATLIHPASAWREQVGWLRALALMQAGNMNKAAKILGRYQTQTTSLGRQATYYLYRIDNRWEELLIWLEKHLTEPEIQQDQFIIQIYLRALGEMGYLRFC